MNLEFLVLRIPSDASQDPTLSTSADVAFRQALVLFTHRRYRQFTIQIRRSSDDKLIWETVYKERFNYTEQRVNIATGENPDSDEEWEDESPTWASRRIFP